MATPGAYQEHLPAVPDWLNKGDNAWQMTASALVGLQSMPGLVILYASVVKKKWAVNSAFMALYAFAAVLICWVLLCYRMAFGDELLPFWGKGAPALGQKYLARQAVLPETIHYYSDGRVESPATRPFYPMATMVYFQFTFAAITMILLAGSVLGRMNIRAWMAFVPLWLVFSYTVGAFSLWGGGFLYHWGVIDYSGGYVIHLSSGIAGFTAAYWVGPRLKSDRERFPPNNVLLMLAGAGLLWMGWSGFNGGAPYAANVPASVAVLNTNISAATSLLVWTTLDVVFFGKPSVIGAVQGMMTGLACITPGAGVVQSWAAIVMGILSGSIPWFTMMILHKKSILLQKVDDTLGVFHTHAVAGLLGGLLTGLLAEPTLCNMVLPVTGSRGAFYGKNGGKQFLKQLVAALFVIGWNLVSTTIILLFIRIFMPLRMPENELMIGDDAVHGEEAYALWGDGEKYDPNRHGSIFGAVQSDQVFWAKTMTLLLQNLPSVPSSAPPLHYTRSHSVVCGVSSSNTDKPRIKPKITRIKVKEPDDYHSTLKALNSKGRIPRKALGQHYMVNNEVNEQLVDAANVGDGDVVLEIGPGTGSLTNVLVESGATILAIEKDPYMAALVTERFASTHHVKVIQEDFTRCHLRSHLSSFMGSDSSDSKPYAKVVANIPFNISSDVVKQLLPMGDVFSEVVLLLQEEAALRMVDASLRTSEYRPINIFINFYSDPEYKFKVPRENFFPQPKVDAAVVVFRLKQEVDYPQVSSTKAFFSMVNSAFNGKRKMLRKSLQHITSSLEIEEALVNIGLPATSRPEELTPQDFVKLHNLIEYS